LLFDLVGHFIVLNHEGELNLNMLISTSICINYILLIVGAALLISGIAISTLWAVPFAGKILHEDTILGGALIRTASSVNASTQVLDTTRPVSLAIHVERNNGTAAGQIPNNNLRETVRNPNGIIMTSNEFREVFFTTFKPDTTGKYTLTVYNLCFNIRLSLDGLHFVF
jgi:hypothetical protein